MRSETNKQIRLRHYPDKQINLKAPRELLCFINVWNKKKKHYGSSNVNRLVGDKNF